MYPKEKKLRKSENAPYQIANNSPTHLLDSPKQSKYFRFVPFFQPTEHTKSIILPFK